MNFDDVTQVELSPTDSETEVQTTSSPQKIEVRAGNFHLIFQVDEDKRLSQLHFGAGESELQPIGTNQAFLPFGEPVFDNADSDGNATLEPALQVLHADGNTSTRLEFVGHSSQKLDENVTQTRIELRDPNYPLQVALLFKAYAREDVIEQWAEISHSENGPVVLQKFASAAPVFGPQDTFLTYYRGNWADEMNREEEKLGYGVKTIASRMGSRAHLGFNPSFLLSIGAPAQENEGEIFGGTLAYGGNFEFQFEIAPDHRLRAICGLNPQASQFRLKPNQTFALPAMIWSYSRAGRGELARRFARWGRSYGMREGHKTRDILLNNWEATYFDFDENKLVSLFQGAKDLGMEMFLLDDGWFGNKYPRDSDKQGLGDWQTMQKKLPNGLSFLADEAQKRGLRFGIWLEPEMVNPKSDLFEAHPDWAIQQPGRALHTERNQLTLDLSNPAVRDWMFDTVDGILGENPGISYVKWDCNRTIGQPGSTYLGADEQSHLYIEYYRSYYDVMARLAQKHPNVEIMNCSGGGGRVDYGSLRFAHEFWPSDNTDPLRRVRMQWEYQQFFPNNAIAAHVTDMKKRPLKFAFDVAMSARMGMDMDTSKLSVEEKEFARNAIAQYKTIREVVQLGDIFRLESPYESVRAAQISVASDQNRAVAFAWQLETSKTAPARLVLRGLDAQKRYLVREINLKAGQNAQVGENGQVLSGAVLMQNGVSISLAEQFDSAVLEFSAQD